MFIAKRFNVSQDRIVDDEPTTIKLLSFLLKKKKYDVVSCENGKQALDLVESEMPDLILMDVMMPVMNGIEVTRKIKKNPKVSNIPVIILSALGQEMEVMKGLQSGADGYVVKPFDSQSLLRQIEEKLS